MQNFTNVYTEHNGIPKKLGVVVEFKKNGETYGFFDFISEMERLNQTLIFSSKACDSNPGRIPALHHEMFRLSHSPELSASVVRNEDFQKMCTVVLNYLCCWEFVAKVYRDTSNFGAGILMCINEENPFSPKFIGIDFDTYVLFIKNVFLAA